LVLEDCIEIHVSMLGPSFIICTTLKAYATWRIVKVVLLKMQVCVNWHWRISEAIVFSIQMLVECVGLIIVPLNNATVIFIYCTYVKNNYVRKSKEKISQCLLGIRRMC
jgi:hypothetical protein